jgi:hypothetical protein
LGLRLVLEDASNFSMLEYTEVDPHLEMMRELLMRGGGGEVDVAMGLFVVESVG